jgi:hypothetical protein
LKFMATALQTWCEVQHPPRHLRSSRLVRAISLGSITFRTKARYSEPIQIRKINGDDG